MLLSRYLGNKTALLDTILDVTAQRCVPGDRVLDVFAGSLAVSMAFKEAGYTVSANDVNPLTSAFGHAYLQPTLIPRFPLDSLVSERRAAILRFEAKNQLGSLLGRPGFSFLDSDDARRRYQDLLATLRYLQLIEADEISPSYLRTDFYDAYCPEGRYSAFTSSRGTTGRRRFLTAENAHRLDLILSQLRAWRAAGKLPGPAHWMCLAVTCHALEKVANTQGTYHDFPRDSWDSRAFKPLTLHPPALDGVLGGAGGHVVGQEDSNTFVTHVGHHRMMYIDPPYNFRQYTAYYFLPNLVCRYPDLVDPETYFSQLSYVRGQNPDDDFTSEFCSAGKFLIALKSLIASADVDSVLISYFTGKNHWSRFDSGRDDTGLIQLSELLSSDLFVDGSLSVREVPRKNYASYGGYRARDVHELLLLADVKR
ncbi:DNA adenine methylase [Cyanobium sp. N.Huapi 1H5]|uniref:DNA adenine methylase n=1 Tax=Cyanobium sp. N.Huapi 1H5 TaxID=2823719 RepID=UPI0020CEA619|nr:DNA adenine methylase [Cyanobium sp. N.Huapi 1H5]MCP9837280.1 DNA adenine methylase [Cyanobium sp. N.Huapi 1H5]